MLLEVELRCSQAPTSQAASGSAQPIDGLHEKVPLYGCGISRRGEGRDEIGSYTVISE